MRRIDTGVSISISSGVAAHSAPLLSREATPKGGASQQLSEAQLSKEEAVPGNPDTPDEPTAKQTPQRRKVAQATQRLVSKVAKQKAPSRTTLRPGAARKGTPESGTQKARQQVGQMRRNTSVEKSPRQRLPPKSRSPAAKAKHSPLPQPLDCEKAAAQKRKRANATVEGVSKKKVSGTARSGGGLAAVRPAAELQASSEDELFTDIPLLLHPHSSYLANRMLGDWEDWEDARLALDTIQGPSIAGLRAAASLSNPSSLAFLPGAPDSAYFLPAGPPDPAKITGVFAVLDSPASVPAAPPVSDSEGEAGVTLKVTQMPSIGRLSRPQQDPAPLTTLQTPLPALGHDKQLWSSNPDTKLVDTGTAENLNGGLLSEKPLSPLESGPSRNPGYLDASDVDEERPGRASTEPEHRAAAQRTVGSIQDPPAAHQRQCAVLLTEAPSVSLPAEPFEPAFEPLASLPSTPQGFACSGGWGAENVGTTFERRDTGRQQTEVENVARVLQRLAGSSEARCALVLLQFLAHWQATPLTLIQSQVAATVKLYRKHPVEAVSSAACSVIQRWRAVMQSAVAESSGEAPSPGLRPVLLAFPAMPSRHAA